MYIHIYKITVELIIQNLIAPITLLQSHKFEMLTLNISLDLCLKDVF